MQTSTADASSVPLDKVAQGTFQGAPETLY